MYCIMQKCSAGAQAPRPKGPHTVVGQHSHRVFREGLLRQQVTGCWELHGKGGLTLSMRANCGG